MNVLEVNETDLPGRRFNGHDLQIMLNKRGIEAQQFVVDKIGDDKNTLLLGNKKTTSFFRDVCKQFEEELSLQSVFFPFSELLYGSEVFKKADIVHYHLIFNYFMSLYSFEKMVKSKPSIWTLHDPWALTGHCVYPINCEKFLTGCHDCPFLDRYAPLKEDNSHKIWEIKKKIYKNINLDLVVASKWMYSLVKASPLTNHFKRVHLIPFGIDLSLFKRRKNRKALRDKMDIKDSDIVIMFRQASHEWKGLDYIKKMLNNLSSEMRITLLTVGLTGNLEEYREKYNLIEYSWVNDDNLMVDLYSVADIFLMPSVAEAFGLMGIESMACSLPVIVFEGTSLPEVTFSPECGISIKKDDTILFVKTVERLILNKKERIERGKLGRKLAEKYYDLKTYNDAIVNLYEEIYSRNNKE